MIESIRRLAIGLLMVYAFAVPWEYSLEIGEPFGNVARLAGVLLLLGVLLLVLARGGGRSFGAVQWWTLGLFLYFACSFFWTVDAEMTLGKLRAYAQVMMVVWLAWEVVETEAHLRWLLRAFVAGCWVLTLLTLLDFATASAAERIRFVAEGQDPNDVARFLDLAFPLAAWLAVTERRRAARLIAIMYLPVGLLAVVLTASRGGFTAVLLALAGSAVLLLRWRPVGVGRLLGGVLAASFGVWLVVPAETLERLGTIPSEVVSGDWNERLAIWAAGWRAFGEAPLWGTGAGTFTTAARLAAGDTAHNTALAVAVTGGLIGLGFFVAVVIAAGSAVMRSKGLLRIALGTSLAVWGVTSMVGSVEENRTTWLLFAVIAVAGEAVGIRELEMVKTRLTSALLPQLDR